MVFQRIEGYPKISDFVAIDFETATEKSPYQIGMAVVKDGVIIKTINRLQYLVNFWFIISFLIC